MLACPSEHSVKSVGPGRCRRRVVLFGLAARWRVFGLLQYRPYWLSDPTLPLAVSPALWFSRRRLRWPLFEFPAESSLEFRLRLETHRTAHLPTGRSRSPALMGFGSLQHMRDRRSTCRGLARPLRSAFRVWLPSWRLAPFDPVPVLFHTGGAHGIHPSKRSPLERYPGDYRPNEPTCRFAFRCYQHTRRWAGPVGRGFWDFTLSRVPGGLAEC
jgi:hypothetical protein